MSHSQLMKPDLQQYQLGQLIGQGQFGKVFKALPNPHLRPNKKSDKVYAVKVIPKHKIRKHHKLKQLLSNQIEILSSILSHKNIVRFEELIVNQEHLVCMVYQYCNAGTLQDRIPLPEPQLIAVLKEIVDALIHAQQHGVIHRDLKPANILFKSTKKQQKKGQIVKLADWGFSRVLQFADTAESFMGSPIYMAPEILAGMLYDNKVDIWSLGIVAYECLFGVCPWQGMSKVEDLLHSINKHQLRFPQTNKHQKKVSQRMKILIEKMLKVDPTLRAPLKDIRNCLQSFTTPREVSIDHSRFYIKYNCQTEKKQGISYRKNYKQTGRKKCKFLMEMLTTIKPFLKTNELRYLMIDIVFKQIGSNHSQNPQSANEPPSITLQTSSPSMRKHKSQYPYKVLSCKSNTKLTQTLKKQGKEITSENNRKEGRIVSQALELLNQIKDTCLSKIFKNTDSWQDVRKITNMTYTQQTRVVIKDVIRVLDQLITSFKDQTERRRENPRRIIQKENQGQDRLENGKGETDRQERIDKQNNRMKLKDCLVNLNLMLDIIAYASTAQKYEQYENGQDYIKQLNQNTRPMLMKLLNSKLLLVNQQYCKADQ